MKTTHAILISFLILIFSCGTPQLAYLDVNEFDVKKFRAQPLYVTPVINTTGQRSIDNADIYIEKILREGKNEIVPLLVEIH